MNSLMVIWSCQSDESGDPVIPFNQPLQEAAKRMDHEGYSGSLIKSKQLNFHHSFLIQSITNTEVESRIKWISASGSLQSLVRSDCFDAIQPSLQSRRFQSNQSAQTVVAKEATRSPSDPGDSSINRSRRLDITFTALLQPIILIHRECGAQIPSTDAPHPRTIKGGLQADRGLHIPHQGHEFSRRYKVDRGNLFASQTGNP